MDLNDETIGTCGNTSARNCCHIISMTRCMRWIENNGQMCEIFEDGNRVDICGVACGSFKGANAALA